MLCVLAAGDLIASGNLEKHKLSFLHGFRQCDKAAYYFLLVCSRYVGQRHLKADGDETVSYDLSFFFGRTQQNPIIFALLDILVHTTIILVNNEEKK